MLTIRLTRVGKAKQPEYRFIVSEKARDPWGKALELLGTYNPRREPATFSVKTDRVKHWIAQGAQCSDTVWNLLISNNVLTGKKRNHIQLSQKRKAKLAKKAK